MQKLGCTLAFVSEKSLCLILSLVFLAAYPVAGGARAETSSQSISRQMLLDVDELAGGFETRRVLVTARGLKIDHRNQAVPMPEAQITPEAKITTDVIDLGGPIDLGGVDLGNGAVLSQALLSREIDVRSIHATVKSNAIGDDRVKVEWRSGNSYFQSPTILNDGGLNDGGLSDRAWSDWGTETRPKGRYIQLRIHAQSERDDFRIMGMQIDYAHAKRPEYLSTITVDDHVQQIVRSTISFGYQRPDHADLKWLRDTFHLDSIVEGHESEFDKVNALCTWVSSRKNDRHDKWNTLPYYPWNVRRLMDEKEGGTIYGHCASYCAVFIACCESLGWQGRHFAIEGYKRNSHETPEIYINELGRWIYFDPSLATYFVDRQTGKPLDTLQMHDIYLATHFNQSGDTVPKIEMDYDELARRREAIDWNTFPGMPISKDWIYGKKKEPWHWQKAQGLMTTAWIQMTPRSNFYDQKEPVFREFGWGPVGSNGYPVWVDDRTPPRSKKALNFYTRRRDFYWTLNQASMRLVRTGENMVAVELGNSQPFFKQYQLEVDGDVRYQAENTLVWNLKPGDNRLSVNCENEFGRRGISSEVTLRLDRENGQP